MFDFLKKHTKKATDADEPKNTAKDELSQEDLAVLEKAVLLEAKGREISIDDDGLAVPEIHLKRFSKDMEYVQELVKEEEEENEEAVETENLAFPEIHLAKLKKRT